MRDTSAVIPSQFLLPTWSWMPSLSLSTSLIPSHTPPSCSLVIAPPDDYVVVVVVLSAGHPTNPPTLAASNHNLERASGQSSLLSGASVCEEEASGHQSILYPPQPNRDEELSYSSFVVLMVRRKVRRLAQSRWASRQALESLQLLLI